MNATRSVYDQIERSGWKYDYEVEGEASKIEQAVLVTILCS